MCAEINLKPAPVRRRNECFHQLRFVVIMAGGMAMGMMMFLRLSITVSMVSMVNHTQLYLNEHPNVTAEELEEYYPPEHVESGEFDWSNEVQEKIITFYMITYTIFPFFTTKLIMKYGLRLGISTSLAICALTNIFTPIASYWSWYWVLLLRLINGCAASGIVPGMVSLIECWTPKDEAAKGVVLYQFTGHILAVVAPLLGGTLASIHWKWAYYAPGVFVLVFCIFWFILISDGPESSKIISQKELDLIKQRPVAPISREEGFKNSRDINGNDSKQDTKLNIPYYRIFRIKEFYSLAIIWCLYCATSGGFIFLLPAYFHRVLRIPVEEVGALTSVAQIGSLFSMLWPNRVSSLLMNSCMKLSLTSARRVVVFICILLANISLLCLAYSHNYLVVLVCINRFFHMTHDTIFLATVMSQFGEYGLSGLVYSMLNSLGCINSTIFCVLVGKFLDYTGETLECWSWVFVTIAAMNVVYLLIYAFFCQSKPANIESIAPECVEESKS